MKSYDFNFAVEKRHVTSEPIFRAKKRGHRAATRVSARLSFYQKIWKFDALKAGVYLKAVFWLGIMFLMQISRLRFKQSRICSLITHIYVLRRFVNFLVIFRFIWRQIVFLKGLVKFMEIGNFEDLVLF